MSNKIYVTGPRNGNYGYDSGVICLDDALKYEGAISTPEHDNWNSLESEKWLFDLDEAQLAREGRLRKMYTSCDSFIINRD